MIDMALRQVSSWFEDTGQRGEPGRRGRFELIVLLAIVAVGIVVRFWGLGGVGLHGDEETMAMPTMHILQDGTSRLPSGMLYVRAIGQLYLMAASVDVFGQSEWALRFPSALCGVLLILAAYLLGRRFLAAPWNLAFTAMVALLPDFIIASQTARMYIFFITSVALFLVLLFKWERTSRTPFLIGAVAVLAVGMQFHTLTVFSAPLLLYPGLLQGDRRKTALGMVAFAVVGIMFVGVDLWISSAYPETAQIEGASPLRNSAKAAAAIPHFTPLLWAAAALAAAAVAAFLVRGLASRRMAVAASVLLACGVLAQILFAYHIAALFLIAGFSVAQRNGGVPPARLLLFALGAAAIAVAQALLLKANGVGSPRLMIGAMTGWPSIWPYIVIAHYSVLAALLAATAAVVSLWRLATRRPVPDFVLFAALGVWVPLLLMGTIKWWIQDRYTDGQALPLLLAAFAAAQWFVARVSATQPNQTGSLMQWGVAAAVCAMFVNPMSLARTVNSGYTNHPDHKGAAEFMESVPLAQNDILVAEDVLQQTYYLGSVDYWLVGKNTAQAFVHNVGGEVRDFYTNTRVLGSGADLQALIDRPDRGAIYVIGSGENQEDGRRQQRSFGIFEMLESPRFVPIFEGRDHLTKVWKVSPPARALATTQPESAGAHR